MKQRKCEAKKYEHRMQWDTNTIFHFQMINVYFFSHQHLIGTWCIRCMVIQHHKLSPIHHSLVIHWHMWNVQPKLSQNAWFWFAVHEHDYYNKSNMCIIRTMYINTLNRAKACQTANNFYIYSCCFLYKKNDQIKGRWEKKKF